MTPGLMVALEAVCLAFMLVIAAAYIFLPRPKGLKKDWFFYSLVMTLLGDFFDMIAWACEVVPAPAVLQYLTNFLSLVMTCFIISAFGYYITWMVNEKQEMSVLYARVIMIVNMIAVAVTVVAGFCGRLFYVTESAGTPGVMLYDDGGFFYEFPMMVTMISLVLLFVLVLRFSGSLGKGEMLVFAIYFLMPVIAGVFELFVDDIQLSYVASCISMSIVYAMLQSNHMNELIIHDRLLNEVSFEDQLTGLLNRRACDRDLEELGDDDAINVVFCDLNGLKQINDEQGHHAGDLFLISFANIISKYFPHESVYRISGDEFLVIARNMNADEFADRIEALRREIDENAGIAALGTIAGTGDDIQMLIKKAEMSMYEDKKNYYRKNPVYRGGKLAYMESED